MEAAISNGGGVMESLTPNGSVLRLDFRVLGRLFRSELRF
jgi:hypothetical protein